MSSAQAKKISTSGVPMISLGESVDFIRRIHEQGLERAAMIEVAKGTGYSNVTSTPFYRRISAARQFGLISERGADLTTFGQDCIKPTSEDGAHNALMQAIESVQSYGELIALHNGKRLNLQILGNWFARKFELNEVAANICAGCFMESVRFAGALSGDGQLFFRASVENPMTKGLAQLAKEPAIPTQSPVTPSSEAGHRFELVLDPAKNRRFVIWAPSMVTAVELKRIQDWLGFQLLVVEKIEEA